MNGAGEQLFISPREKSKFQKSIIFQLWRSYFFEEVNPKNNILIPAKLIMGHQEMQ